MIRAANESITVQTKDNISADNLFLSIFCLLHAVSCEEMFQITAPDDFVVYMSTTSLTKLSHRRT